MKPKEQNTLRQTIKIWIHIKKIKNRTHTDKILKYKTDRILHIERLQRDYNSKTKTFEETTG
jgi:hypothetical protein